MIREVRAAIVLLDDGSEVIPLVPNPYDLGAIPLLASDEERFMWLDREARELARTRRKTVWIVRFIGRQQLAVIDGRDPAS